MAFKVIGEIEQVLDPLKEIRDKYYTPQVGPLRHFDREMRCASRGCGSSTFYKLLGIPKCTTHCLMEMNIMLHEGASNACG